MDVCREQQEQSMNNGFCSLSYLKGLYSFGLLETRFYDQAEKVAMEVRVPLHHTRLHAAPVVAVWSLLSLPSLIVPV